MNATYNTQSMNLIRAYREGRAMAESGEEFGINEAKDLYGDAFPAWFSGRYDDGFLAVLTDQGRMVTAFKTEEPAKDHVAVNGHASILDLRGNGRAWLYFPKTHRWVNYSHVEFPV